MSFWLTPLERGRARHFVTDWAMSRPWHCSTPCIRLKNSCRSRHSETLGDVEAEAVIDTLSDTQPEATAESLGHTICDEGAEALVG